ncbi:MAG: glycosyltransferase [Actinobacteria bacterium]|nr:glycosyltransferase [Actinomycetota bacterium]
MSVTLLLATAVEWNRLEDAPLGRSLASLVELGEVHVLDLDPATASTRRYAGVRRWTLDDVGLPALSVAFALDRADLVALSRPLFLTRLLSTSGSPIVFVDAGCLVRDVGPLAQRPRAGIELVPALHADLIERKPSLRAALEAGAGEPTTAVIRLGCDGAIDPLLGSWGRWMLDSYVEAPEASLNDAERDFLSSLPARSPVVGWEHGLVYAHWSDLDPSADLPAVVDTSGFDRYAATTGPAVDLIERRTHSAWAVRWLREQRWAPLGPTRRTFASGAAVPTVTGGMLRANDPMGARWTDPFDDTDGRSFVAWLADPDGCGATRFAHCLYWARPDLRRSFPAASTPGRVFSDWLRAAELQPLAAVDGSAPALGGRRLLRGAARRARRLLGRSEPQLSERPRPGPIRATGVNLVGYARAESGLGESMRSTGKALSRANIPAAVLDVSDRVYSRQGGEVPAATARGTPFDVTVFHLNPDELLGYATDSLAYRFAASWNIGFWFWETEEMPPSWSPALDAVDEVWVATSLLQAVFERHTDKPVTVVGLPVDPPSDILADRARLGLPRDAFVVSYVSDAYSGLQRKDPLAAVEAFAAAYGPSYDGAHLALKVSNLEKFPALWARLEAATATLPVTIVGEYLPRSELWGLLAASDVYLSLHASEGFGLTIAEAMALEIPCVVTAYGGNMDFTDEGSALLVPFERVPAAGGPGEIYTGRGTWARPDVEVAAQNLRSLRDDRDLRRRLGTAGRRRIEAYSLENFTARIVDRLSTIGLRT